jgi:signal transduction histidine kinase
MAVIQAPAPPGISSARVTSHRASSFWLRAALSVPLELKVLGANAIIVAIAAVIFLTPVSHNAIRPQDVIIVFGALALGTGASYALIRLALKPVQDLEQIARRISQGRIGERVPSSLVADPDLAHLAATMNDMLDNLAAGRERMRKLGAEVVYAQERERAQVARDLHDSVAQTLAAASFQIAAAANEVGTGAGSTQLSSGRELIRTALEEIRTVSRSLHPRVADDLGLPAALESLADVTRQRSLIDVKVRTNMSGVVIPPAVATTLYRVAQEALRDVERQADAGTALVSLSGRAGLIEMEIQDDGGGFDDSIERARSNPVLARMRERLSLAGGELHIDSMGASGTRVVATVRLETEAA